MIPTFHGKAQFVRIIGACTFAFVSLLLLSFTLQTDLFAAPVSQEPSAPNQTGTIAGQVTGSDGGDVGLLDILISGIEPTTHYTYTILDASGRYTATGLTPGNYSVHFNFNYSPPYLDEYYTNTRDYTAVTAVAVTADTTTNNIDAELQLGAIITGVVTDEGTGEPVSGMEVEAFPREVEQSIGRRTTTDATGHFQLTGLYSGTYKVCYGAFDNPSPYLGECYDNKSLDTDPEQLVTVTDGAVLTNINAALTRGGTIYGQVTSGLNGEPLPNIRVEASGIGVSEYRYTMTNESGYYALTALPTGNYRVTFNSFLGNETYAVEYYNETHSYDAATPVAVTVGMTTTGINAVLDYVLNITGRVEVAGSHQPIGGLYVQAYDMAGVRQYSSGYSDATGHYTLTNLAPGPYRIRFGEDFYVNEFYSNSVLFEEATILTVTDNVTLRNIDASLARRLSTSINVASGTSRPDALIATRDGGFNPLFTLDNGQTWQMFVTQPFTPTFGDVPSIALAPKEDPNQPVRFILAKNYYSTTENDGIFRSADEGAVWSRFEPTTDARCDSTSSNGIYDLVTSPADPLRAYATVVCSKYIFAFEPYHEYYWNFYTSLDGGVGWGVVAMPLVPPLGSYGLGQFNILPSPVQAARVYLSRQEGWYAKEWARSDNSGQSWLTETFTIPVIALDWVNAAKLYGVVDGGESNIFRYTGKRSIDTGATWQEWAQQPCRTSFQQLITLPTADTLLMLCDQGLLRSTNAGDSWELLTPLTDGRLEAHNGDRDQVLWMRGDGLWSSSDRGETWNNLSPWSSALLPNIRLRR